MHPVQGGKVWRGMLGSEKEARVGEGGEGRRGMRGLEREVRVREGCAASSQAGTLLSPPRSPEHKSFLRNSFGLSLSLCAQTCRKTVF